MKPFLFLGTRGEDDVADGEYAAVLGFSGLGEAELHRHRLEGTPLPAIDLADWSGIVLGGGPFNVSDPDDSKSPVQLRVEGELRDLAARVVAADFPFLGACYGTGTLGTLDGGVVDRRYGEPIGPTPVALTDDGIADPLFGVLPREFVAFLGHKEAVSRLPAGAVRLALSADLPGAGVPDRRQRLRHPVPPGARRARAVPADRGLRAPRLLRPAGEGGPARDRPLRRGDRTPQAAGPVRRALRPLTRHRSPGHHPGNTLTRHKMCRVSVRGTC